MPEVKPWQISPLFVKPFGTGAVLSRQTVFTSGNRRRAINDLDYIRRYDQSPLALAGLWEAWRRGDQTIESFTIITVEANTKLKALHQRMPAILEESKLALWLDPAVTDPERIQSLLQPDHGVLEWYPVSTVVNNPENEGQTLISEVPLTGGST